jgi:hypothetical protein
MMLSTRNSVLLSWNSVLLWLGVLALGLVAAEPAGAIVVRTAAYAWTPAAGPVAGYAVYLSIDGEAEESYGAVNGPSAWILVESGAEVVLRVAAFNTNGQEGPRSDASPPLRLCPGDFDGDELVAPADVSRALSCLGKPATGACAGAEVVVDGIIRAGDIRALEVGSDACESLDLGCPGDIDGDGVISADDVYRLSKCVGLYAQGSCAGADFDGNGYVSTRDWALANEAIGTTCSN